MKKFNPEHYVFTANQTWKLKEEFDKFLADNSHLAAPFHIDGLENILPKQYPGNLTVHFAKSHHGKSTALRNSAFKAQQRVENTDFMIGIVSLEDSAETTAASQAAKYGNDSLQYRDDQMIFIGNSFKMSAEDMGRLNMGNIIRSLEYGLEMLPNKKGYSHIYLDYEQIVPADPEREAFTTDQRRLQIADDVRRLYHAAKQFKCPIDFAAQALLKQQKDAYTSKIRIPGAADLKEAGELYEIPDIAIAYWQPKHEPNTPIGTRIEEGQWCFTVEQNLCFIRIAKWRNAERMGFTGKNDIVGRIFPCWIREDGSMYYDPKKHSKMYLKPIEETLDHAQ